MGKTLSLGAVKGIAATAGRSALLLTASLLLSGGAIAAAPEEAPSDAFVSVTVQDGRVSVEAREAPLDRVLGEIAEQAHFKLSFEDAVRPQVSWRLRDVPIEKALQRLLLRASYIAIYRAEDRRLTELRVLRSYDGDPGGEAAFASAAPPPPAAGGAHREAERRGAVFGSTAKSIDALEPDEKVTALQDLIRQPDSRTAKDLVVLASDNDDPVVRAMATVGLGRLRVPDARDGLLTALGDDDSIVRMRAVQALGRNWSNAAAAGLAVVLADDPDPQVRREAALALARTSNEEALSALERAQYDDDEGVRQAAFSSRARQSGTLSQ